VVGLESIALFRDLGPDELRVLRLITQERRFAAGHEIFHEGDPGDGVYFVKDGLVEVSSLINPDTRCVLSQVGPGEIFGEMAVIEHRPRSATVTALKDTEVYFVPRGEILSFVSRSPGLALRLLQEISHRLREFDRLYLREIIQAERLALVGNFARSIVHDLKNPLNIIGLAAEIMSGPGATPEKRAQSLGQIRRQIVRLDEMIGDILEFTRDAPKAAALMPVDYHDFVLGLLADLRAEAGIKAVRVELRNDPPAIKLLFDPHRLRRVFYNLMHNATDAMPEGGGIFLAFSHDPKEVVTEIEDTGSGIAPEMADKLFEAFATHGKTHGTGLGLFICKKIVGDFQGRIWARNEPGRGAVFAFALPLPK